jgi:arylsulfate sulfotransferase
VTITGTSAGPTPFISNISMVVSPAAALEDIRFIVRSKPLSVVRPVSVRYSAAYLSRRGLFDASTGQVTVLVFGLYENYSNTIDLVADFTDGTFQRNTIDIRTAAFVDPTGGIYKRPIIVQSRARNLSLNYDYFMLRGGTATISPVIVDTEGEVRWVGTAGLASKSVIVDGNSIVLAADPDTGITRMELDGSFQKIADYAAIGVVNSGHHNYDPGKYGILVEVDTTEGIESTIIEVDRTGAILKTWRLADILSAAMIAAGDDPSAFIRAADDWFHNNSATYRKADDTLIVSSRENFVIALDYERSDKVDSRRSN